MLKRKTSAIISLVICALCSIALVVMACTFPAFVNWFYTDIHGLAPGAADLQTIRALLIPAFYICVPIAAAALYMLIAFLLNIIKERVFIRQNVIYLRLISWCCYAVTLVTLIPGVKYLPLLIISCAMVTVGTLLRVMKNMTETAVALREEHDLTI
ncbi:MAG: DUF2975 domain-containing protein [Clostridia bacterium]|nr:DUF2975 domain-containing protein [Clostridia bacterium]